MSYRRKQHAKGQLFVSPVHLMLRLLPLCFQKLEMPLFPTIIVVEQSSSLPTLAPLPALLGVHFFVVPLQLGNTDPHGDPQYSVEEIRGFSGERTTRRKSWAGKKANVKGGWKKEVMLTLVVGQSVNVSEAARAGVSISILIRKDVTLWLLVILTPPRKKGREEGEEMRKGIRKAPPTKFPPTVGG